MERHTNANMNMNNCLMIAGTYGILPSLPQPPTHTHTQFKLYPQKTPPLQFTSKAISAKSKSLFLSVTSQFTTWIASGNSKQNKRKNERGLQYTAAIRTGFQWWLPDGLLWSRRKNNSPWMSLKREVMMEGSVFLRLELCLWVLYVHVRGIRTMSLM